MKETFEEVAEIDRDNFGEVVRVGGGVGVNVAVISIVDVVVELFEIPQRVSV